MKFILERTSIPVPKILAYELDQSHPLGAHMLLEKVRQPIYISPLSRDEATQVAGVRLDTIFDGLPAEAQHSLSCWPRTSCSTHRAYSSQQSVPSSSIKTCCSSQCTKLIASGEEGLLQ